MDLPKHNSLQSSATHRLLSARDLFPPSPSLLEASGITFPFLLRLPGIVADFVVILVLLQIKANDPRLRLPIWALVIFALSPLSIMVSGYHGNTDPVMVMLFLFSVYFCSRDQPVLSGLFFALSAQVKIVPLLFFPILLFFWMQRRVLLRFVVPFAAASAVLWSEPLLEFPLVFAKNVLSVRQLSGESGASATCSGSRAGPNSAE